MKISFSEIIHNALKEDLGDKGDITTNSILINEKVNFAINTRENLVVCGIPILEEVFNMNKEHVKYEIHKKDGDITGKNSTLVSGEALAIYLLPIERVILNFIQHASGIASITRQFVDEVSGTKVKIRSTRKTTPGLRMLDKYSVCIGGGESYRDNLCDGVLIKDNHIASCGSITLAIQRLRKNLKNEYIAIECDNISQVEESLSNNVDMILLDNMSISEIKKAVDIVNGKSVLEVSGCVNIRNVRNIALTGVDYISIGCITNSFQNKDIGLDIEYNNNK
ncbi:nicotinate-nucleotide diphosphorylase [Ehrlichia chaffeensis str. Heartland]|uniref:nicotinate-nucleotide diphosphorylase (carboxylating) n=2 Tax=Ehrlichia chaffeensis (strain ATCC CRL-10679 / Arkansas) TaxID=205920 RepID=Q2GI74_EHRCR|nr:carboxylating nicotinate-nucleotide diphosphorylase [Ehrlichia chaffeensis]ABD45256.1 nicotinate-nucleotide pyrophosphorylase [Ehrlichia chaffeensis str. Arkansas]AHX03185.1 nicotinate-nucleotide diphosphorylase [Ehrlichia chaffeensis str. Heartland]AHX05101.1 nicotinate-nucleotide diphosphorylase [Ehrlichia chaffeensis str. Jax]AHX07882.1 nicotinate-nucleotide diphosphorylase [Ehrlichia chaffeensis str. Osceola]AHX08876.1 nicotinate-nucleotide diphosphorylase [Ehrlichia chaffeensis str. Sa